MNEIDNIGTEILVSTLAYARDRWVSIAQSELKSSREEYIRGIGGVVTTSKTSGYVMLTGKLPVMTEKGYTSFDIKKGFALSPKAIKKGDGWYLTVPFRHRTSGSNAMPNNIKNRATKLDIKEILTEGLVRQLGYGTKTSSTGYTWRNSKYDSLNKITKEYSSGNKRSQYVTFRRVSNKSDPRSWVHPGYKGLHAVNRVVEDTNKFAYDYANSPGGAK